LKGVVKGLTTPTNVIGMYQKRKQAEQNVLSSHGDATRFFVTFLDNHDMKERIRYLDPGNPHKFDDQVTLGLATLLALPGVPCVYYGTEQGLSGHGTDEAVREALWGGPKFNADSPFYQAVQQILKVRAQHPALRYGRFYFRPVSGDGLNFGPSSLPGGVLAFSRILNDEEVLVVANTNTGQGQSLDVIVEVRLSQPDMSYQLLYSNNPAPKTPSPVRQTGSVTVAEVDGTIGHGPLHVVHLDLEPMEVQILGQ
jgi:glycosidase